MGDHLRGRLSAAILFAVIAVIVFVLIDAFYLVEFGRIMPGPIGPSATTDS